jgi:hypothetical protein
MRYAQPGAAAGPFDYAGIVKRYPLIVDSRNALKGIAADHIFRL